MKNNSILALLGGRPIIKNKSNFNWPIINKEILQIVKKQTKETISIYNRSGIFEKFENRFAEYHNLKYALVGNSGTTSIYTMYVAAGLGKGDEVICPAYTFFATVSPLLFTGATPILADCDENGNINPKEIKNLITSKTKAIVVTHMWGIPAQMEEIKKIAEKNKLLLLEDCSHAHGASINNKKVGSWGNMSAWSLQGQKIITGGEGGIFTTNNPEFYYRALLLGHYNKRCKQEIPSTHPLYKFSVTGMGLKFRAHPLAIAIADYHLQNLDKWLSIKRRYATKLINSLKKYKALQPPIIPKNVLPSWYALVWRYQANQLGNIPINTLYNALQAEGLTEFDLPNSTCPLNKLPLLQNPHLLFPQLYPNKTMYKPEQFPNAEKFYKQAIKLSIWVNPSDKKIIGQYIDGFKKVLHNYRDLQKMS
ncbi:DegT/DnrJ/EryC1/StrS family aminotransferase [Patescibacteria group bacterium]|nr:DegT/DnrJ/EryC1/StrS family aminotransferase [Patescibacteria group bacterium]